ncbi:hypothetical protein ES705_35784 [subsurface metagenome]
MSVKAIQALMTGLVVLACVVGGIVLIIVGSYLGLDLTPWIPLGKNQRKKGTTTEE